MLPFHWRSTHQHATRQQRLGGNLSAHPRCLAPAACEHNRTIFTYTNKRTDKYGDPYRFAMDIIRVVKSACGEESPVCIRVSADEFLDDEELTLEEEPEERMRLAPACKKVKIIGGVPILETPPIAKLRQHDIFLFEKEGRLGGTVDLAAGLPKLYTSELGDIVTWERSPSAEGGPGHMGPENNGKEVRSTAHKRAGAGWDG